MNLCLFEKGCGGIQPAVPARHSSPDAETSLKQTATTNVVPPGDGTTCVKQTWYVIIGTGFQFGSGMQ